MALMQRRTNRMKCASLGGLYILLVAMPAIAEPLHSHGMQTGIVQDFDPTSPGLHDYAPPQAVGRGHANAHFGAGYIEFLFSGGNTPRLPPRRVYVGPLESEPYGNRRLQLREGMSPRAGTYIGLPEGERLVPLVPYAAMATLPHMARKHPALASRVTRQIVPFEGPYPPGTIVIKSDQRFLYLVQSDGRAVRYVIGVGQDGFGWKGVKTVSAKRIWPDWRPPADMLARRPDLPQYVSGGPHNPLGARALYLGNSLYRIHGSNEPETVGTAVSSGCFRMTNEDVNDLYERVPIGTKVVVL